MENFELVICPYCGKETSGTQTTCQHCGGEFTLGGADGSTAYLEDIKSRNGFVGFYLWLCFVINAIICFAYFITLFTDIGMTSAYEPMSSRFLGTFLSGCTAAGLWLLLKYKKLGFYLLIAAAILTVIININMGYLGISVVTPIVSIALLFSILQIKKDGKSCWSQLD